MYRSSQNFLDRLAYILVVLFGLERILKLAAVIHFFRRRHPPQPASWPTVTLLQPITRGASRLAEALRARPHIDYPAAIQHLLICDANDLESQTIASSYLSEFPSLQAQIILVESSGGAEERAGLVATKIRKLQQALPRAKGEVLCFVDDDVTLRPDALRVLVPYLFRSDIGVAFGLPSFTNWQTIWSSLISWLINAHMLLNFVALTYLIDPFRINGHVYALRSETFKEMGGFDGLEQHIDDEFEMARRVQAHKLRAVQTPLIYDIDNALDSPESYAKQFKRWFVTPRQSMMPFLTLREKLVLGIFSFTLPLPSIIALLTLFTRRRSGCWALVGSLMVFGAVYVSCEQLYLKRKTPLHRWPLLPIVALWTPLQIIWTLLLNNEVEWRGQRLLLHSNGTLEIVS